MDKFLIAAVFGPFFIIFGLARLFDIPSSKELNESFKNTPALVFLISLINVILGLFIVNVFNIWAWNMALLVTLLGWFFLVRGILLILFYKTFIKAIEHRAVSIVMSIIALVWGIALTLFAHY